MEALKRAYAEIILNTAAESAARILASERKALALQRSLASSKQDAVDMMLRLKAIMEAKILEAETRNTLHAARIHQLESQLRDAQYLILTLQADLDRERRNAAPPPPPPLQQQQQDKEESENTSSYYNNLVSIDNSNCSVKDHPLCQGSSPPLGRISSLRVALATLAPLHAPLSCPL